jgi:non-heme chloroperoxidase
MTHAGPAGGLGQQARSVHLHLDIHDVVLVGHSTGGGEVTRYMGRHGTRRVAKAVLLSAIPPLMLKTDANPQGLPVSVFDELRAGVLADRSQFYKDLSAPFYGANRPGSDVSQGKRDEFWSQCMSVGIKGAFDCIKAFSETDTTADLKTIDVPTLIAHGDDDQIVPIVASAMESVKLVKNSTLKIYPGGPHGLTGAHEREFNADLLDWLAAETAVDQVSAHGISIRIPWPGVPARPRTDRMASAQASRPPQVRSAVGRS